MVSILLYHKRVVNKSWVAFLQVFLSINPSGRVWGTEAIMHSIQPHGIDPTIPLNKIDRDLKKVENNNFRWEPLQGANIFQIFSVIIFFKKYLEVDLLGKIQLVPLRGHCNLSEIIKTQENVKGELNMWKKVKLNEQGTPNISSEITLSFENGSESSQFGQILKSELF